MHIHDSTLLSTPYINSFNCKSQILGQFLVHTCVSGRTKAQRLPSINTSLDLVKMLLLVFVKFLSIFVPHLILYYSWDTRSIITVNLYAFYCAFYLLCYWHMHVHVHCMCVASCTHLLMSVCGSREICSESQLAKYNISSRKSMTVVH